MADLQELEREAKIQPQTVAVEQDDVLRQDVFDAISLLCKCLHLLDYLEDPDLCKSLAKRERESIGRVSVKVKEFLTELNGVYEED